MASFRQPVVVPSLQPYGSFTRAGEMLHYSQSGISRMIGDLERGKSGVRLTSDGVKLLPYVQSLCQEYARLEGQVDELNGLQSGLIRIGTFSSVATHWLPNIISRFQQDYPNIDYELLLGDYREIETWVRTAPGGLRFSPPACRRGTGDHSPGPGPAYGGGARGTSSGRTGAHSVKGAEQGALPPAGEGGRTEYSQVFARSGLTPKVHFTTWDDYAVMSMVECGLGLSILPELILRRIPYCIVARELDPPAFRTIGLVLVSRQSASLALRRFLDYLPYR